MKTILSFYFVCFLNSYTYASIDADAQQSINYANKEHTNNKLDALVDSLRAEPIEWKYVKKKTEKGEWIEVSGSSAFVKSNIKNIEKNIWIYLGKNFKGKMEDKQTYTFQYKAISNTEIYIQASCEYYTNISLKDQFYEITDGGTCFFSLTYEMESKKITQLFIHGNG